MYGVNIYGSGQPCLIELHMKRRAHSFEDAVGSGIALQV